MTKLAKVGVYIDKIYANEQWSFGMNVFSVYLYEILDHLCIPYQKISSLIEIQESNFDLILAGTVPETGEAMDTLWEYMGDGGTVLAFSNLNRMAKRLGYQKGELISKGYSSFNEEKYRKLKFFHAFSWRSIGGESKGEGSFSFGTSEELPVFQSFQIGEGRLVRSSIDIAGTIVKLQQGELPVFEDGSPAKDGTGGIDDDVLKVDDQIVLDWEEDRQQTETGQLYFGIPYADLWREVLIKKVIELCVSQKKSIPFIGYWPSGIEDVALMSHDSDYNQDEHALTTLELLRESDIHSTWCMILPGYSKSVYEKVINEGHELAFHYNAVEVDEGHWGELEFKRQLDLLKKDISVDIQSNKNHLTRFEGWGELFKWCEENNIQSDQTRGASKKGNLGFSCGTCHPYFPIAWGTEKNRLYNVLELGFLTPDINTGKWADESIIEPLLTQVKEVKGVAHFLFHQIHLHRNKRVRAAFKRVIDEAKKRNFVFWTGREINEWERYRRGINIKGIQSNGEVQCENGDPAERPFVIYRPLLDKEVCTHTEDIFGFPCQKQVYQAKGVNELGINV